MTQYLNSSQSSGGDGRALWGSLGSPARLYCKLAGRADGARNGRNHSITDFFQPAPKQDRAVSCSPEKRNGKVGLPVSHADHPRRNISSPKQNRKKKFLPPPPDRSPIIDAFFKNAKIEKKDSSNNDGASITTYPKVVVRKLFTSQGSPNCSIKDDTSMRDLEKNEKCPVRTRTPLVENSRECKMEYMDLDTVSSGVNKWVASSENDSLRKESHISWCPKTGCSKALQSSPASASHPSSTEILGGDKQVKREKKMLFKQQSSGSVKQSLAANVSQQDTMDFLRKRSCSASWESSTDCDHVTILPSSCTLNELSSEDANLEMCLSNKKLRSLPDSEDGNLDCSLDSSDDEILLPFEEILAQCARPTKNLEPTSNEENGTQDIVIPSHSCLLSKPSIETQVSYVNRLEHLLKEKEELTRVDELEKQLQEVKQQFERELPSKELPNDGELSAEHRAFIERFSVIDAIPDQHPGENIFQMAHTGKIFSQHNLDLRNCGFFAHNPIEKYLLGSGVTQQLFVINEGLLMSAYHSSPCPVPILKWMFQMMSVHSDRSVSKKILDMLMILTINASVSDPPRPWIPSLCDIATVLINMGVPFNTLFPLRHFQPTFTEDNIMSEMCRTVGKQATGNSSENLPSFFLLVESSLCNIAKFLQLCVGICPEHYTDKEILLLLLLLFKLSLEKELKQFPLVDLEYLIIKLLENIRKWDAEMPKLCLAISDLSSHHHDLLWLVQFVPNWTARGRQARRHLSLVVISKLLKNHVNIPRSKDQQMALLCQDLVQMKPSNLLKKIAGTEKHQDGLSKESLLSESEPQAYYLTYVLLHLVREASNSEAAYSNQKKWLLKLCGTLEKHVKCDIREDARLFYRTKVKDLVARTYSKWQQMIHSSRPTQGKIHDFWDPDS